MLLMPWGRVGSNLLFDISRQLCGKSLKAANENLIRLATAEEQSAWFNEFYEVDAPTPTKSYIGSKQNLLSIRDFDAMQELVRKHDVKLVRLRRDNIVKAALSQMRAQQYADLTKKELGEARWAVQKGDKPLGPTDIDCDLLMKRIAVMESTHQRLMSTFPGWPVLDIEYEEINAGLDDVVRRLCTFLELPEKPFNVAHAKLTPDDLSRVILNYPDVCRRLEGTPYEQMLNH